MKQFECQLMWQSRIQAFHVNGEASIAAWCKTIYTSSKYALVAT